MKSESTGGEVFKRVEQEHEFLRSNLTYVRNILDNRGVPRDELLARLNHLRAALVDHFWREENEGFFDEVSANAPRLVPMARKLCAEHQDMMRELSDMVRFAAAGAASEVWRGELKSRFLAFSKQLMHHESEENSLLQQAM